MFFALIKPLVCSFIVVLFLVLLLRQYTNTNYVGDETNLLENTGVCTNVQMKEHHEIGKGSRRYDVILITINDKDYELGKNATKSVTKNQNIDEFNKFVNECIGEELTVQYPAGSNEVASLFTSDSKTVYLSLKETEKDQRPTFLLIVFVFFLFVIMTFVICGVFFWATKPEPPYFMQKKKEKNSNN